MPLFENQHVRVWDYRLAPDADRFCKPCIAILEGEALQEIRIAKWPDGVTTMLVVKKRLSDGLAQATTVTVEDVERHVYSPDKWLSPLLLRWALNTSEQGAEFAQSISGIEVYRAMGIEIPKERGFPLPFLTR